MGASPRSRSSRPGMLRVSRMWWPGEELSAGELPAWKALWRNSLEAELRRMLFSVEVSGGRWRQWATESNFPMGK